MAFSRIYMCITTFVFRAHWENASALWDNLQHIYYMYVRVRGWDDDVTFRGLIDSVVSGSLYRCWLYSEHAQNEILIENADE